MRNNCGTTAEALHGPRRTWNRHTATTTEASGPCKAVRRPPEPALLGTMRPLAPTAAAGRCHQLLGVWKTMLLRIPWSLKGSLLVLFHGPSSETLLGGQGARDLQAGTHLETADRGKAVRRPPDPTAGRPSGRGCGTASHCGQVAEPPLCRGGVRMSACLRARVRAYVRTSACARAPVWWAGSVKLVFVVVVVVFVLPGGCCVVAALTPM